MGDGSCFENSRAMSLEGSTPSPSASCSWPIGTRRQPSKLNRRVRSPQSTFRRCDDTFGDRLTVGRLALNQAMEVRFLLPELTNMHSGAAAAGGGAWL